MDFLQKERIPVCCAAIERRNTILILDESPRRKLN